MILTKLDGDTRGGAALSIHSVTGAPIKFIGVGEKLRRSNRSIPKGSPRGILGMGDALTLIEKTRSLYSEDQAKKLEEKFLKQTFTLDDFLEQMRQVRKLGSFNDLLKMIRASRERCRKNFEIPEREFAKSRRSSAR